MSYNIKKFEIIPRWFYMITIDSHKLSIEDIFRIINDREIAHIFFKRFPDYEPYPFIYLMEDENIAREALKFLEPYIIMRKLIE